MLHLTIPATELWDENRNEFVQSNEQHLTMEHSLISISKWESKYEKPFLTRKELTLDEEMDYFRAMTITPDPQKIDYSLLTIENLNTIQEYIARPMTATKIYRNAKRQTKKGGSIKTAEDIYFLMVSYGIPFECEKWHLNRLLKLIEVCQVRNSGEKMTRAEVLAQNRALNKARRAKTAKKK